MALILAGLIEVGTLALCFLIAFANGMSDAPGTSISSMPVFIVGTLIAGVVGATHWVHIGW